MLAETSTIDRASRSVARLQGTSCPLGPTVCPGGVNFSVFSKHATAVQLLFFDRVDAAKPSRAVELDPRTQRSYHYWHAMVPDISAGQLYPYRVDGPFDPEHGHRFDREKVLLDPYGKCVARPAGWSRAAACAPGDNCASALKSVVAASLDSPDDVCRWADAPTVPDSTYLAQPHSVVLLISTLRSSKGRSATARSDDRIPRTVAARRRTRGRRKERS